MSGVPDLAFVVAAYGVVLGGVALYAVGLARRLRRVTTTAVPPPPVPPADPPADTAR